MSRPPDRSALQILETTGLTCSAYSNIDELATLASCHYSSLAIGETATGITVGNKTLITFWCENRALGLLDKKSPVFEDFFMFWCLLYHGIAQLGVITVKRDMSVLPSGSAVTLLRLQPLVL